MAICGNCGEDKRLKLKDPARCDTCYSYLKRTKHDRPQSRCQPQPAPTWCKNCERSGLIIGGRCLTCRGYYKRHGKERPRRLWDNQSPCRICGIPKFMRKQIRGRCVNCDRYKRTYGTERPQRLWGIGPHGWCECGWPAIEQIAGMSLCKGCAELERS